MVSSNIYLINDSKGDFGKNPEERTIPELLNCGIINIDKPKGPTSHLVVDHIKKILKINKAGHSGTLDPGVTGVQPIALNRATRITHFLLTAPKEYVCLMHLHQKISIDLIKKAFQKYVGEITQLPPVKSAVKREKRIRRIYDLKILEIEDQEVLFKVKCQAGVYIRKLCSDLGQELKIGAHMAELRRTQAGSFNEQDNLVTLNDVQDAYAFYVKDNNPKLLRHCLQPIEKAIEHLPKCWVLDTAVLSLTHGRSLAIPGISKLELFDKGETVAILTLKGELIAIGEAIMATTEIKNNTKGQALKLKKVFMEEINPSPQSSLPNPD